MFVILVELHVLGYAYQKIGVRPRYVFGLMLLTLLGRHVNIPLYSIPVERVNVGGALIPTLLSVYLLVWTRMWGRMLVGVIVAALAVRSLAAIVAGVGIVVPTFVSPLVAAGVALLIAFRRAPPVAYVAGSMGTLVGADVLNLGRVADMGAPVMSIGGAGTFDGVFLTGIIAGLLA